VATYGEHLRQQVEDRLKYYETGEVPAKNLDVMHEAIEDAQVVVEKALKKKKKAAKRAKKLAEESMQEMNGDEDEELVATPPVKKIKKMKAEAEA